MKVAILSANLGNFDDSIDPVVQELPDGFTDIVYHRFTDADFPPIIGLTPRLQYRIPKLFGWEMFPGYDYYIWLDGGISFKRSDSVKWYIEQIKNKECLFFKHPWRRTIRHEVGHIDSRLKRNDPYITPRYKNGLHNEIYQLIQNDTDYVDDILYASTVFVYKDTPRIRTFMKTWWYYQSRYFTCDQIALTYLIRKMHLKVESRPEMLFKIGYLSLVSHHK